MSRSRKSNRVGAQVRLSLAVVGALATAGALASAPGPFAGTGDPQLRHGKARLGAASAPRASLLASSVSVTSCADDFGAGTLRQVMNTAEAGGTVDLSGLSCSNITLLHGAIEIPWPDLNIVGPGSGRLTVDAGSSSRVFKHTPENSTFSVSGMRVAHGRVTGANVYGGCIYARGSLVLEDVVVTSCEAIADGRAIGGGVVAINDLTAVGSTISDSVAQSLDAAGAVDLLAAGGGAYAGHGLALVRSVLSGNQAIAAKGIAFGGGAVGPILTAKYSTISGNDASSVGTIDEAGIGGGLVTSADAILFGCTIDNNSADAAGALFSNDDYYKDVMRIAQTTISGNIGRIGAAALDVVPAVSFENSTVAFNVSDAQLPYALFLQGAVTAKSSIFANNMPADLLATVVDGDHNLIKLAEASTVLPMDTKTSDPKLQPLGWNGGLTRTHALGAGSPAIDHGSNPLAWQRDQRGPTYRRVVGASADIGALETDPDHIFGSALEFPSG